jgi:hypothetical protein
MVVARLSKSDRCVSENLDEEASIVDDEEVAGRKKERNTRGSLVCIYPAESLTAVKSSSRLQLDSPVFVMVGPSKSEWEWDIRYCAHLPQSFTTKEGKHSDRNQEGLQRAQQNYVSCRNLPLESQAAFRLPAF